MKYTSWIPHTATYQPLLTQADIIEITHGMRENDALAIVMSRLLETPEGRARPVKGILTFSASEVARIREVVSQG